MLTDLVDFDMCWAFDLVDPWGNQYELNCYEYDRVRAELVEADAVEAVRYWPRELYAAYLDARRRSRTRSIGRPRSVVTRVDATGRRPRLRRHRTRRDGPGGSRLAGSRASSLGDGGCSDGLNHVCCVGDLDLAGLGLLGYGDGEREHAVLVAGGDVVTVQTLPQEQLTAELALGSLRDLDLVALGPDPGASPAR